jgi:maleamate amidohydrolase
MSIYCKAVPAAVIVAARPTQRARRAGCAVVLTNFGYELGGADGGVFFRKTPLFSVLERGSPLGAFTGTLEPQANDLIVTKNYPSAFLGTRFAQTFCQLGVDAPVIVGFSASGCIRASALDALQHGFIPFVARDACADQHADPHEANLFDLQAKYAEVVWFTEATAIFG